MYCLHPKAMLKALSETKAARQKLGRELRFEVAVAARPHGNSLIAEQVRWPFPVRSFRTSPTWNDSFYNGLEDIG
jgi:hypothetical protein